MRKTKKCVATTLNKVGSRLMMRTCLLARRHEGDHVDEHGRWSNNFEGGDGNG